MVKLEYICDRCGEHTTTTRSDIMNEGKSAISDWHSTAIDYDGKTQLKDVCPPCYESYTRLEDELIMKHKTSVKQWLMELKS